MSLVKLGGVTLAAGYDQGLGCDLDGNYLYVSLNLSPGRFSIIDISDPLNPTEVGHCIMSAGPPSHQYPRAVSVLGNYAYVALTTPSPGALTVIDITNKAAPSEVATVTFNAGEGPAWGVFAYGTHAYVTTNQAPAKLIVVDISNPLAPSEQGVVTFNAGENYVQDIVVAGVYAFMSTNTSPAIFLSANVTNPAAPARLAGVSFNAGENQSRGICFNAPYAYCPTYTTPGSLVTWNCSNPAAPSRVTATAFPAGRNNAQCARLTGSLVYCLSLAVSTSVCKLSVSNPASPSFVEYGFTLLGTLSWLGCSGDYAYAIDSTGAPASEATMGPLPPSVPKPSPAAHILSKGHFI
jgi:hypothetical protein